MVLHWGRTWPEEEANLGCPDPGELEMVSVRGWRGAGDPLDLILLQMQPWCCTGGLRHGEHMNWGSQCSLEKGSAPLSAIHQPVPRLGCPSVGTPQPHGCHVTPEERLACAGRA